VTERVPLPDLYSSTRVRLTSFVSEKRIRDDLPVPATPGWTVHDVIAHLAGVAQDLASGRQPTGGPTDEWTAGHVERGRGIPTADLLVDWQRSAAAVEELLAKAAIWPVVLDAAAHEQDIRGAVGDTGARDCPVVHIGAAVMLKGLQVPHPLVIETEQREVRVGPDGADVEPDRLVTSDFEAFRWRLGRRSRQQLAAMRWSGDPEPYLDHLCVFGPAQRDVVE
jgi:hypothetical protein